MQKQLIREATARGKPVIVATQMLESMISNQVPIDQWVSDASVGVDTVESRLIATGAAAPGDDIAITFGRSDIASGPGRTNVLWLWRIR